jgi:hypothetical protein
MEHDLTARQIDENNRSKWAIFLPAVSGFYSTFIGRQRYENYVDQSRMPMFKSMEELNWFNSKESLFPYKWSLFSGGHADLDLSKVSTKEDMLRNREPSTFVLGDSGGFQIAKGLWEGDWKANSKCSKAQKKRDLVLNWLDNTSDYAMTLDIPTWVINDKKASNACKIFNYQDAVDATKFNNEYFIKHRKGINAGGTKILNVLQGSNHTEADKWYNIMKIYCDPYIYPERHFNGWAMGGQNMCCVHLVLKRLVALKYDNLLQEGVHDWMHFLGTSKLEWAVLLTIIQKSIRKYVNPNFTISFDCASPFLATANGQVYNSISLENDSKWLYRMTPSVDDKKYSADSRSFKDVLLNDCSDRFTDFIDSPISSRLKISDVCYYKPGDLNKNGKEGKTSWDSFSYALQMGHNVWTHIHAVQSANEAYETGIMPAMMRRQSGDYVKFEDVVEAVFSAPTRQDSEDIIEYYSNYFMEIIGTRGFKGKKTLNSTTYFNALFEEV